MNTSNLSALKQPTTIVLSAGHGAGDPGAVNGTHKEAEQAVVMVDSMANGLRARGVDIEIVPHSKGLSGAIKWVNDKFDFGDAWVIEIHRDSADGLSADDASRRCGVYTGTSDSSQKVGEFIREGFIRFGMHDKSWTRVHTESPHKSLGWINKTNPLAHLLELGFMEGDNSSKHILRLADVAEKVLFEAFTGKTA